MWWVNCLIPLVLSVPGTEDLDVVGRGVLPVDLSWDQSTLLKEEGCQTGT